MGGSAQPFLKWTGGKRWLAPSNVVPQPQPNGSYFEPFLGSGAMFFAAQPAKAVLSDANGHLIELYEVVRDEPLALARKLAVHQDHHSAEYYYGVRRTVPNAKVARAARTLYLNRTCWNGLYRVNRKGEFNVPIGTKTRVLMDDDFEALSSMLKTADLRSCDFADAIAEAGAGDVVYADPPYTVRHNVNGFLKYNEQIFSWDDQIRLRNEAIRAAERGATIVISNADHESIHDLYAGIATVRHISRASVIAGAPNARGLVTEALIFITAAPEAAQVQDLGVSTLPALAESGANAPLR